jgi:hypothetical protein
LAPGGREATVVADHDELAQLGPDSATVSALGGSPDRVLRADEAMRYPDMGQH